MSNNLQIHKTENFNLATIEEVSEEIIWLENFTSKATQKTYKGTVKKFCSMFEIQNIDQLRSVTSMHIIKFRDAMKEAGEKNASINNRLSGLSSLFKHLIEKQLMKSNPVYGVKAMKKDYRKVKSRALSDSEIKALLEQPNQEKLIGLRDKAILAIMFNLGVRVGTIEALRGKDIYEENGYLIFDMYLKGDKRNLVAVNSHVQSALIKYFEELGYYKKDVEGNVKFDISDDLPVFPNMSNNPKQLNINKPMTTISIWRMWKKYSVKANIDRTNPHCARATFITRALKSGCDLQHVQHTAGHNDPRTTMSYNHNEVDYKDSASFSVSFG